MDKDMFKQLIFLFLVACCSTVIVAQEKDLAIHEELRGLLSGLESAVNEERYGDLAQYFHENLQVTTINQETISSPEEIEQYFIRWFGPDGYLSKVDMTLTADETTKFFGDHSFGIVRGSGVEKYILSDSRAYDLKTRWTATVIRGADGKWRILTLHIGTNFLDNPILDEVEASLLYFAGGGLIAGIVLMLVINLVRRRAR
jgi:ketosteroid isomerase-like protein